MRPKTVISAFLTGLLLLPATAWPQQAGDARPGSGGRNSTLKVVAIQGEGATNNIRTRSATAPVVEVRDENDKPVANAVVLFQLPYGGPGGDFNEMRTQTVNTNDQGRAAATSYVPNHEAGRFNIQVMATYGSMSGKLVIGQSNVWDGGPAAKSGSHKKLYIVLGAIAVGGIAGGAVASQRHESNGGTVANPVTITTGPVTVGTPR